MFRALIAAVLALAFAWTPLAEARGLKHARLQRKLVRDTLYKKGRRPTRPVLQQLLPDLQVLQVHMTKDHTHAYDYPKVHVVIRNVGHVPTSLFYVNVSHHSDGVLQTPGRVLTGGMAPGEIRTLEIALSPSGPGVQAHEITVTVDMPLHTNDPDGEVLESNEGNNVYGPLLYYI